MYICEQMNSCIPIQKPGTLTSLQQPSDRLGKLAFPRVNDKHKIAVDDKKLNSGRPPHEQIISGDSVIYLG